MLRAHGSPGRREWQNNHIARASGSSVLSAVRLDTAVLDVYGTELTADDLQPAPPVGSLVRFVLPVLGTEQVDGVKK